MTIVQVAQGTTKVLRLTLKKNDEVLDISNYDVLFHMKDDYDGTIIIEDTATKTDAANGRADVTLSSVDTNINPGTYFGEAWLVDVSDQPFFAGRFHIEITDTLKVPE